MAGRAIPQGNESAATAGIDSPPVDLSYPTGTNAPIPSRDAAPTYLLEDDSEHERCKKVLRLVTANVVAAVIFGGLLLLLFLFFYRRVIAHEVCGTQSCEEYAHLLGDALNESVRPCESFTHFVCDGWSRRKQHGVPQRVVTGAIETLTRLVNVTYLPKTGQNSAQRGLALYRSCDAVLQGTRHEVAGVKAALREAGITWPLRPTKIDIPHMLLATSLRLGWDVMFRVLPLWKSRRANSSRTLLLNSGRTIIEILNKTSSTSTLDKRRAYFDVLRQHLRQSHGGEESNYTDEVTFEQVSDAERIAVSKLRRAYYKADVIPPVPAQGIMDVPEIGLSRHVWEETLSSFGLNDSTPPSGLQFGTANEDYFNTFLWLWKKLKNARMHLFVSWCTVQVGALFANQELIANFYGSDLDAAKILHGAFCFSRAFAVSGPHLFGQYNQQFQTSSTLEEARRLALLVRRAFHDRLLRWSGYDKNVTVVSDWNSLDTLFGLIQGSGRATKVKPRSHAKASGDQMFSDLDENALLSNFRKTSSDVAVRSPEFDVSTDVEVSAVLSSLSMLHFSAIFYGRPDLQLMPYAITFPIFDFHLIPGVNFGAFGAEIAKTLGVLTLKAYHLSGPLASEGPVRKCFRDSPFARDTNLFLALAETLALGALVDAYDEAYAASPRGDRRFIMRLPGFTSYSGTQLLFIAYCLPKCRGNISGETPPSACNLPLSKLPEFAQAFQCATGTPMNPTKKCELI
ncbi:neprilysin-1-like [Haemaphysalis longicornis]